jgi:hypothetical protein
MAAADAESVRRRYRPSQIRVLFVGESAPAGGTFFYAENSTLYFEMREAFAGQFPKELADRSFLNLFRALDCYLDDLCLEPVNHLPDPLRRRKREEAEKPLASRLRRYRPFMVVAIGKTTTAPHVGAALEHAGMSDVALEIVAFPGRPSHKVDFHATMSNVLASGRESGIFQPPPGDLSSTE